MKQKLIRLVTGVLMASFFVAACAPAATTVAPTAVPATAAPATAAPATAAPATAAPATTVAAKGKVCEVTDTGGVDDKAFNALAWIGAQAAAKDQGWDAAFLESKQQTDYDKNINEYLKGNQCSLIVTVGFLMGAATQSAGAANPNQKFQILDNAFDMTTTAKLTNVWAQLYSTEQGAFMAGYVAAAMSKTGKIGTFGGINIPPVDDFMVGFQEGMQYYNTKHNAKVQLLGWDNAKKDGLFTGDFNDQDKGRQFGQNLLDEGADVIMPVAGRVGLGTYAAVKAAGNAMAIGVDADQYVSAPDYQSILLTSVQKRLDVSIQSAAKAIADGSFKGGIHVATLATGEIGIAPFHDFDSKVPQGIKDELKQIASDISSGAIKVDNFSSLGSTAPAATPAATAAAGSFKGNICEVTDVGGVDDKAFNALAWIGAQAAAKDQGTTATFLESKQQTDYDKNLHEYLNGNKCGLIVTVGFLMGDATKTAGLANPNQKFQGLDIAYDVTTTAKLTNVWQQVYATEQGAFMAGYVAAAMSKTGKIGTFGGINFPAVADFMVGFQQGMQYYNTKHNAKVQLLGWDNAKKDGLFTGDFTDKDKGKQFAQTLLDEGADVIMPVAGSVGLGAFAAVKASGNAMAIGVDADQYVSAPDYQSILLTSVQKRLDVSIQSAAKAIADGSFKGGIHVATLSSGEIGIAPFHDFDSKVPQAIKDELKQIAADISSGALKVDNFSSLK